MTEPTGPHSRPGDDGDEPLDVTAFLDGDALAEIEREARARVKLTKAGAADATTGTVRLTAADTYEHQDADDEGDGTVIEQLGAPTWRDHLPETFLSAAVWRHRWYALRHRMAFHSRHAHLYTGRLIKAGFHGARYGLGDYWGYVHASDDYGHLIAQAKHKQYSRDHLRALRAEKREEARVRRREAGVVLGTTAVTSYVAVLVAVAQVWGLILAGAVLVPGIAALMFYGHREHSRRHPDSAPLVFLDNPGDGGRALLGEESINNALRKAGVLKDDQAVSMVGAVRAVDIDAAEGVFDLPDPITISTLRDKREQIAAAFRVEPFWLDFRTDGHPGRIRLWLANRDPFGQARVSPLVAAPERTDVWNTGILIGYNRRGEPVHIRLRHVMALLGGMSRTGKGMLLRNLICGLGLDPRVRIRLVAGAKPGEHRGYARVCATFFGRRPGRLVVLLDALLAEAYRREEWLEEQGRAKLGEKDLEHFPLEILIIDEYKQYANSTARVPDPRDSEKTVKACDRIAEQLEELAAFAAALNITVLVSTQDPDAGTIPRGYKSNSGARVATRTGGAAQTNAILKDGATGAGLRAHEIPESLKGGAIVDIDGAPGELIRSFFIEDEEFDGAEPIIDAGLALRQGCGAAPGQYEDPIEAYLLAKTGESSIAGGPTGSGRPGRPDAQDAAMRVLDLVLGAFPDDADRVPMAAVRAHLDDYDPDRWGPVDGEDRAAYEARVGKLLSAAVAAELDGTGVTLRPKAGIRFDDGTKGSGFYRTDVEAALNAARNATK